MVNLSITSVILDAGAPWLLSTSLICDVISTHPRVVSAVPTYIDMQQRHPTLLRTYYCSSQCRVRGAHPGQHGASQCSVCHQCSEVRKVAASSASRATSISSSVRHTCSCARSVSTTAIARAMSSAAALSATDFPVTMAAMAAASPMVKGGERGMDPKNPPLRNAIYQFVSRERTAEGRPPQLS